LLGGGQLLYAQTNLPGKWYAENLKVLSFTKDSMHFSSEDTLQYWIKGDTLVGSQRKKYKIYKDGEFKSIDTIVNNLFRMEYLGDSLYIRPISAWAAMWLNDARPVDFNKYLFLREKLAQETWLKRKEIKLQALAFQRTSGETDLSNIKLDIQKDRTVFLWANIDTLVHPNHNYQGYYKGKLSQKDYNQLLELLKKSVLDHVDTDWHFITCGSIYQLAIIDENGYAKYHGGIVPTYCQELIAFLDNLFKKVQWQPIKKHSFDLLKRKQD